MTLNVRNYETELRDVFQQVTETQIGRSWVILEYEGNSNILRVGEKGEGGLEEFSQSFDPGKLQYGIIAIRIQGISNPKVVFVQWQGEGVPVQRLAQTTAHINDVQKFFKTVHIVMYARCDFDVEPDTLMGLVRRAAGDAAAVSSSSHQGFEPPEPVGAQPSRPNVNTVLAEREQFWKQQDEEEKERLEAERLRKEEERKRLAKEREEMVSEFQKKAAVAEPEKITTYRTQKPAGADSKSLVSGRAKMFQQIADQQVASAPPPRKPSTGKPKHWEVKNAPALASTASYARQEAPVVVPSQPAPPPPAPEPAAVAPPPLPVSSPPASPPTSAIPPPPPPTSAPPLSPPTPVVNPVKEEPQTNGHALPSYDLPPELPQSGPPGVVAYYPSTVDGTKAVALWDYQAEEDNEISFEPDQIITEIEMIDEGWWRGRGPNGDFGLFPANYVKLL